MKKRSVTLKGHSTSITLEDEFWEQLKHIASAKNLSVAELINIIDEERLKKNTSGLSSALRVYVLNWVLENPVIARK